MGTGPTDVASAEILQRAPATRPWARTTALTAYAALFVLWSELLGIPRGTLQVFAWLWLGTIAWHVEAEPRYHLNFVRDWWPPVVGLLIYFYSRGLTDDLGLPVHFSLPISVDAAPRAQSSAARTSARPTPRPRASGFTYHPSMNGTGDDAQPGAYLRWSSSSNPIRRPRSSATNVRMPASGRAK